jgi:hypothetical protein
MGTKSFDGLEFLLIARIDIAEVSKPHTYHATVLY